MSIYEQLNDREWLNEEYSNKQRSQLNISKEIGCGSNSVRQALIKFNIPIRNPRDAQLVNGQCEVTINKSILDGSMMGDAYFYKWRKGESSYPSLMKKNKYKDHLTLFAESFTISPKIKQVEQVLKATGKTYTYYQFRTGVNENFQQHYERWYPKSNNYKKVIPDDIEIDSEFLLHWFLDDGCSFWRKRENQRKEQVLINFASECFEKDQQERLCEKINEKYQLNIRVRPHRWDNKLGYRCHITQANTERFFDIIGECPVESMAYKWKRI